MFFCWSPPSSAIPSCKALSVMDRHVNNFARCAMLFKDNLPYAVGGAQYRAPIHWSGEYLDSAGCWWNAPALPWCRKRKTAPRLTSTTSD
jgi:hypothetical protein